MEETFLGALHADPWAVSLVDLPDLNKPASGLIEDRISGIRDAACQKPAQLRSESLVLLGPPGTGKTHLFARVRGHLGPRAVFVHIRPLLHAGLTPSYVLGQAVHQLAQPSYGRADSQADMLVGSLIGYLEDESADFPAANLSTFRELPEAERARRLGQLVDQLFDVFPDLDDLFVERLLALPFAVPRDRRALFAWLSGQDCDPSQLARIGAAASMDPANAVRALRSLTSIAAVGAPLVIVFDQLENLVQRDGTEERITQYGNLVAELVDSTRGLLVVQLALDSEWEQAIAPGLNLSQRSRLMMTKSALSLPTSKQSRSLVELWCGKLQEPGRSFPWPLNQEQLERLCGMPGVTPRMLLSALKEAAEGSEPSILQSLEPATTVGGKTDAVNTDSAAGEAEEGELSMLLAAEWLAQVSAAHHNLDQADQRGVAMEEGRLRDGLLLASSFAEKVSLKGVSDPYIQLESKAPGGKWVCLLHQAHFRSVGAALDRVLSKGPAAPGVVVREQWRAFPPTWKSAADRQVQVLGKAHLVWHELGREEAAFLLGLEALLQLARSRDICDSRGIPVTEEQVVDYLRREVHPEQWRVVAELGGSGNALVSDDPTPLGSGQTSEVAGSAGEGTESSVSNGAADHVLGVLLRLRVASVDRVIREVHRLQPELGRTAVVNGLDALGKRVMWFGRSIVALQTDAPMAGAPTSGAGQTSLKEGRV